MIVVLDACVLVNFSLCDTLLRLAEPPRLFEPKWSEEILSETIRALELKLAWPPALATHFKSELRAHFSDAWLHGHEHLIPTMTNDEKDRHVAAAAVHGQAQWIVTLNLRHFRREHLEPWGVTGIHPEDFLISLLRQEQNLVTAKLKQQAADRNRSLAQLVDILSATVPEFASLVAQATLEHD